jgi:pimeloyl-ACP methyl ester carboxylesterase
MSSRGEVARRPRRPAGEAARERLLAGLPVTERRLDLAGVSTAVLEGGDGPPVVLLHGLGEFAVVWMRVIPGLAASHRVVVPDLPAHGASTPADGPLDADRVLGWLDELIGRTCPSPPALVGHCLGGAIAARFALAHGHRLGRLVLVDAYGLDRYRPSPAFTLATLGYLARPGRRSQDRMFRQCMADLDGVRGAMGADWAPFETYALDRAGTPGMRDARRLMALGTAAIPPADLDRIAVPTTLIWGREDRQVRLRVAEAASARHGWPLRVIEGAADDPAMERPGAFLTALRAALGSA